MATKLQDLHLATLLSLRKNIDSRSETFACLELALEKLRLSPLCVTNNVLLTVVADHNVKQWYSGKGECEIVVYYSQGKAEGKVYVATWEQYLSCLCFQTQILSLGNLLGTRSKLRSRESSIKNRSLACFDEAVKRFLVEPTAVKQDARMLVECAGQVIEFVSGVGSNEISVFLKDDIPVYTVQVKYTNVFLMRIQAGIVELNSENLREVRERLEEGVLKCCFNLAVSEYIQEPKRIQENARLLIMSSGETLQMIAGKGENKIVVFSHENEVYYQVLAEGWWDLLARILNKLQSAWLREETGSK